MRGHGSMPSRRWSRRELSAADTGPERVRPGRPGVREACRPATVTGRADERGSELRVGIVGYGLMGKAHSYGYRVAPMLRRLPVTPVVTVMSGRDGDAVAAAAGIRGPPSRTGGS